MNAAEDDAAMSFTKEQKEYLQGFTAGLAAASAVPRETPDPTLVISAPADPPWFGWPVDEITREEQFKREANPLDIWDKLVEHAQQNKPPQVGDIFRFKFHGLFYVAPAQDSLMVRVRIPANAMSSWQMRTLGRHRVGTWRRLRRLDDAWQHSDSRDCSPAHGGSSDAARRNPGLTSRGSRRRQCSQYYFLALRPASMQRRLIDTRPMARALQFYLLNNRDLFGLPRKFNVSFDGAGRHQRCLRDQ